MKRKNGRYTPKQGPPPSFTHTYLGEDAAAFMRNEPATAVCGFTAEGKAGPNMGKCEECANILSGTDGSTTWVWT